MRQDVFELINGNQDLKMYIRLQPFWYRALMRNPHQLDKMETEAAYFFKKSIPHRVTKFSDGVQMTSMLLHMFEAMNTQS
ncbi:hypothetical protein ELQ35_08295 [Peribacillus cavernae]|uniref:YlbE-like protein n=1 Tax=Peribacillus cavernae TaxID=1674310 RepID=A0A3S1B883_9BACI|nr:YlbE-like family protein [Peribacillus cavernae]MDQ0217200.1 hypothetical protein [Peribacillus cavernae]RUQ30329.1 hypothetical protein ELQ35_08295 [Peribacillus cavernae]